MTNMDIDLELVDELAKIVKEHALESLEVGNIKIVKKMHLMPEVKTSTQPPARDFDEDLLFHSAGV